MRITKFLVFTAFTILLLGCSKKNSHPDQDIKIYMVALEGTNLKGKSFGCNDMLVPVSKSIPSSDNMLEETLNLLLAEKDTDELKNFIRGPQLILFQVNTAGGVADIYFTGDFLITRACDILRIEEQITETVKQFSEIKKAKIYINNQTLDSYLKIAKEGFN